MGGKSRFDQGPNSVESEWWVENADLFKGLTVLRVNAGCEIQIDQGPNIVESECWM